MNGAASSDQYYDDTVWTHGISSAEERYRTGSPLLMYQPPPPLNKPQHTTIVHSSIKPVPDSDIYKVGIYGWRKRCLYVFVLVLTLVIIVNLAMTIWIMIVLDFSADGIGAFKVDSDGIKVQGRSEFEKPVLFSQLSTPKGKTLSIDSAHGLTISAHNFSGYSTASLDLNPEGKASAVCERFEVLDANHKLLFFVDSHEIGLKLENLRILGHFVQSYGKFHSHNEHPQTITTMSRQIYNVPPPLHSTRMNRIKYQNALPHISSRAQLIIAQLGGTTFAEPDICGFQSLTDFWKFNRKYFDDGGSIFEGAIQTAVIRPEPDNPLSLESPTRSLQLEAGQDIELLSGAGEIQLNALLDIHLKSNQGDIRIESGSVYLSGLERSAGHGRAQYQLCVCQNGRLFMAVERSDCRADRAICG